MADEQSKLDDTREIVSHVLDKWKEWEKQVEGKFDDWKEYERLYRVQGEERKTVDPGKGRANTCVMEFHRDVESFVSSVMAILFSDKPFIQVEPEVFIDPTAYQRAKKEASVTQKIVSKQLDDSGYEGVTEEALRILGIYGQVPEAVEWEYRHRMVPGRQPETGLPIYEESSYADQPKKRALPPWKFAYDTASFVDNIQDCGWVIEESDMTKAQIKNLINKYAKVEGALVQTWDQLSFDTVESENGATTNATNEVDKDIRISRGILEEPKGTYRVLKYFGPHPKKPDEPVKHIIVIVNDTDWAIQIPLPDMYNHGLFPYTLSRFISIPGSPLGLGLGDILYNHQVQINERRNMITDLINFGVYGIWKVRGASSPLGTQRKKMYPGMWIDVNIDGDIEQLVPKYESVNFAVKLEEWEKDDMRYASAATPTQQAMAQGDTATEIRTVAIESARRVVGMAKRYAREAMRPQVWMMQALDKQYMTQTAMIRLTGAGAEQFMDASGEAMLPDPDISIRLAVDLDFRKDISRRLSSAIKVISDVGAVVPEVRPYMKPTVEHLLRLLGVEIDTVAVEQQQAMAQQMAMAQQAPPGLPGPGMQETLPPPEAELPQEISAMPPDGMADMMTQGGMQDG